MKQFVPLPLRMREAMAPHHRRIQGAIVMIAHSNMGIRLEGDPKGAERYKGGVYVNGHQIVIKDGSVFGDDQAEQEEIAVADAINMLRRAWKTDGEAVLDRFPSVRCGDPLPNFHSRSSQGNQSRHLPDGPMPLLLRHAGGNTGHCRRSRL